MEKTTLLENRPSVVIIPERFECTSASATAWCVDTLSSHLKEMEGVDVSTFAKGILDFTEEYFDEAPVSEGALDYENREYLALAWEAQARANGYDDMVVSKAYEAVLKLTGGQDIESFTGPMGEM